MNKEYVISIDLGGTNVRVGIVDNDCKIIKVNREFTIKENKEALANQICRMIGELPYKDYNVKEVGISACGFVHQSFIKYMKNLNISDFDLKNIKNKMQDIIDKNYKIEKIRVVNKWKKCN